MRFRDLAFFLLSATSAWPQVHRPADDIRSGRGGLVPVDIAGRVLLDKATPPSDPVPVTVVCDHPLPDWEEVAGGHSDVTDASGNFLFVVGYISTSAAVNQGGSGLPRMSDCSLTIRVAGFEPYVKALAQVSRRWNLHLGDILLKKSAAYGAGSVISATSDGAPVAARKEYLRGVRQARSKGNIGALRSLQEAVRLYPAYAAAYYTMGQILERDARRDEAKSAYQKASAADSNYVSPLLQLARMAAKDRDWKTAGAQARRVVELSPSLFPDIYLILVAAQLNDGDPAAAEKSAREGLAADAASLVPQLHLLLAETLSRAKRFDEAREQYLRFAAVAKDTPEAEAAKTQALTMEKLARRK